MVDTVDDGPPLARKTLWQTVWSRLGRCLRSPFRRTDALAELPEKERQDLGIAHRDIGSMVDRDMARLHTRNLRGH